MADDIEVGLALSGGGYRAMLFGLGTLWRLNELGWLPRLDMVTSVSGGSILNGVLATRWSKLEWESRGGALVASNFASQIAEPICALASRTIDVAAGLGGLLSLSESIADKVTDAYNEYLFHGATLQSAVPPFAKGKTPRFLFYATSLQTGSSVRIERKRFADFKIGEIPAPDLQVARVVAASSAFPPVLSPVELRFDPSQWKPLEGSYLFERTELKSKVLLTDGGVYDNMGLQELSGRAQTILVSDAGAPLEIQPDPATDWTRQVVRVLDIVTEQTRALRRHALVEEFEAGRVAAGSAAGGIPGARRGAYWGITTKIASYPLADAFAADTALTESLQHVRTRLSQFAPEGQGQLVNWGYALADAAMRTFLTPTSPRPVGWPFPAYPL